MKLKLRSLLSIQSCPVEKARLLETELFEKCSAYISIVTFLNIAEPVRMRGILLLTAFCAASAWSSSAPAFEDNDNTRQTDTLNYRLPTVVLPSRYVVELTPYLEAENGKERFTFDGKVDITLRAVSADIRQIVLHLNALDVTETPRLRDAVTPLTEIRIVSLTNDTRTHKYTLFLEKPLPLNENYVLSIQFVGYLSTNMRGFYRSSYQENGTTK